MSSELILTLGFMGCLANADFAEKKKKKKAD